MKRIALVMGVMAALAMAAPALAGESTSASRVSVYRGHPFHGFVHPGKRKFHRQCRTGRLIHVYEVNPSSNKLVGTGVTNRKGAYSVPVKVHHSTYFVQAERKILGNGFRCLLGDSHQISYSGGR
jgi:hypothetical protein